MDLEQFQAYINLALTWIGFGTVVGLTAKALMPGRDPGGSVAVVLMGIVGTLIGCALLKYFYWEETIQPVSVKGFFVGTAGALVILTCYKVLGGYWLDEGEYSRKRRRRRRMQEYSVED
ncbi:MAG TPA: GlsB/YeaQ/YmgE family stress response membrane protein [Pirellulaceae bacterium]|nr:GlsB/YeaQ/YmgE family stress response membrane protein [Pirellulaceae bacterium]HMO93744.1 GlsB/YeaQ/YmgE family stress response membrane protein [Pirellulaceae bacterium]HMP69919.1 GlsB/YeaQ/YmgE family stress response membrane protein [Pirellulaceae bacterium]